MTSGAFQDINGFTVDVGIVVGWAEGYEMSDKPDMSYLVVNLPNLGDMVEMVEMSDLIRRITDKSDMSDIEVISVEPWKIGVI